MFTDVSPAALRAEALRANTIPFVVMAIEVSPGNWDKCSKRNKQKQYKHYEHRYT